MEASTYVDNKNVFYGDLKKELSVWSRKASSESIEKGIKTASGVLEWESPCCEAIMINTVGKAPHFHVIQINLEVMKFLNHPFRRSVCSGGYLIHGWAMMFALPCQYEQCAWLLTRLVPTLVTVTFTPPMLGRFIGPCNKSVKINRTKSSIRGWKHHVSRFEIRGLPTHTVRVLNSNIALFFPPISHHQRRSHLWGDPNLFSSRGNSLLAHC